MNKHTKRNKSISNNNIQKEQTQENKNEMNKENITNSIYIIRNVNKKYMKQIIKML